MNKPLLAPIIIFIISVSSCSRQGTVTDWCYEKPPETNFILFDQFTNHFTTWNHITDSGKNNSLLNNSFDFSDDQWQKSCQQHDHQSFHMTLVKKIGDWDQQHLNGMEIFYGEELLRFSEIKSFEMTLKIDSKKTYIPNLAQIREAFNQSLTEAEIYNFEKFNFNLGITLFEPGGNEQTFNVFYNLEIAPDEFDQWLNVTIPINEFNCYLERNYQETYVTLSDYQNRLFKGIRLCAETHSTKVVRNLHPEFYHSNPPDEVYKELSFAIGQISLGTY